ncbi:hypothetical protein B0H21DRAFT_756878 [Amylocystis lapponica]|nr:hypothetical protein B0H21DRAFT_756878 [Amylocystis lapponica]
MPKYYFLSYLLQEIQTNHPYLALVMMSAQVAVASIASSSETLCADTKSSASSDMSHDTEPVLLRETRKLWFPDGNVVLVAEDTPFRVHASVLSRVSAVFRDLFRAPATESWWAEFEGCRVFQLQDTAEDLETLTAHGSL